MFELTYGYLLARRVLLTVSILAASCCALWAQADGQSSPPAGAPPAGEMYHHRPGVERELNQLTHILSLTGDQQTQVKAILTAQRQQIEQLRNSSNANGQAAEAQRPSSEQIQSIRQDANAKIEALLNDEQKAKFEAWVQQQKERMQKRRGPDGDGAAPQNAPGA
jgi:Spy/CpxP family protein refolding chaperone